MYSTKRLFLFVCGLGIFFVGLMIVLPESGRESTTDEEAAEREGTRKREAWVAAQQFVLDRLFFPESARLGCDWEDVRSCVTGLEDEVYQVRGWVDAENHWGTMYRSDFDTKVKYKEEGDWELVVRPRIVQRRY